MDIVILLFAGVGAMLVILLTGGVIMIHAIAMQRKAVKTQDGAMDRVDHSLQLQQQGMDRVDYSLKLQEQGLATSKRLLEAMEQLVALQQEQNRLLEREGK